MRTAQFSTRLNRHLGSWASANGIDPKHLEVGRRLVLRREFQSLNLFDPAWWSQIEGKTHRWARALNSSQCFGANLFGPLTGDPAVATHLARQLFGNEIVPADAVVHCRLEETPRNGPHWLGERRQPTQVDVFLDISFPGGRRGAYLIEVKLAEKEFGGCRGSVAVERGGKNPDSSRCLDLAGVRTAPAEKCWMSQVEGRRYWDWIEDVAGSFRADTFSREVACPFRDGLYQLMRNRVLADALVARGGYDWARLAVCIHPNNERVRKLSSRVADTDDAVEAIRALVGREGVEELEPANVIRAIESASPSYQPWAAWVRSKYLLD